MVPSNDDLDTRLDTLARRVEATINNGQQTLAELPEFEERNVKAKNLDTFMRRFGGQ